ncbi:MAG: pilus assembly protein PilP [Deltaproteobacteria bacterium]|nr:pilus assembly protein PilP [Deltaproteobacteria bacterium]
MRYIFTLFTLVIFSVFMGCSGKGGGGPVVTPQQSARVEIDAGSQADAQVVEEEAYVYTPVGKRDPFRPFFMDIKVSKRAEDRTTPLTELETYDIEQLRLTSIISGIEQPMAMVEDPTGKGHTLVVGTLIGKNGGRVARIKRDEVIIEEEFIDSEGKRIVSKVVLKLPEEKSTNR